jgi:hypothetical protein
MIALKSRQILTWWLTVVWSVREIEKNKGNYFLIFFMTLLLSFFVSSTNELEKINTASFCCKSWLDGWEQRQSLFNARKVSLMHLLLFVELKRLSHYFGMRRDRRASKRGVEIFKNHPLVLVLGHVRPPRLIDVSMAIIRIKITAIIWALKLTFF